MCNAAKQLVLDSDIVGSGKRFLAYRVAEIVNDSNDHDFWANPATLAGEIDVDPGTVRKYLRAMVRDGLMIEVEAGGGRWKSTRYRFVGCAHLHGQKLKAQTAPPGAVSTAPPVRETAPPVRETAPSILETAPPGAIQENSKEPEDNQREKTLEHVNSEPPESSATPRCVFDYWRDVMDHPRAKFTPKRRQKITGRLKEGYTVDDLKQAIDGCRVSPYHQGQNDTGTVYDDIELICRSGEKVEQFQAVLTNGRAVPASVHKAKQRHDLIDAIVDGPPQNALGR